MSHPSNRYALLTLASALCFAIIRFKNGEDASTWRDGMIAWKDWAIDCGMLIVRALSLFVSKSLMISHDSLQ